MYLDKLTKPKYDLLTKEEELDLIILAQCGCKESLSELVEKNVNTVWHFLNKTGYANRHIDHKEDLFQCGVVGLIKGIMKFDYNSGHRLSTYASNWIRQEIGRAVHQGITDGAISVPVHHSRVANILLRATVTGIDVNINNCFDVYVSECRSRDISIEYSADQIKASFEYSQMGKFSGNETFNDSESDNTGCFFDSIAIDQLSPEEALRNEQGRELIIKLINEAPIKKDRDRDIIKERFGLIGDPDGCTLEFLGNKYGCTRENIRLIEAKILKILRSKMKFDGYNSIGDIL